MFKKFLAIFAPVVLVFVAQPAMALTYDSVNMSNSYPGSISSGDCLDPARGTGYSGDVFQANSNGTISIYMEEGPTGGSGLEDKYFVLRATDSRNEL